MTTTCEHPSSNERCVCGAVLDREKYTICTHCKRNIPPMHPGLAASRQLLIEDGWLCEAGCIDMGLARGSRRSIGAVIELGEGKADIEIRGITQDAAHRLAEHVRGRVRVSIELLGDADEQ